MPRPRLYSTDAERQAAYRDRRRQARDQADEATLPRPSALPNIAARRRWTALLQRAHADIEKALQEMQSYYEERSEEWQESDRGQELQEQIDELQTLAGNLDDLLIS